VKAGSEDEFVARWRAFLCDSTKTAEGFGTARLLRDSDDPRHFPSFSEWPDAEARDAWKSTPDLAKGNSPCRKLCDDFVGADYSQVASI
jgi:heme-degrading monooxygenase HmoA